MKDIVLQMAAKEEEEKLPISFRCPKSVKETMEQFCKDNNISLSAFLVSCVQVVLQDGFNARDKLYQQLKDIQKQITEYETFIHSSDAGDPQMPQVGHHFFEPKVYLENKLEIHNLVREEKILLTLFDAHNI